MKRGMSATGDRNVVRERLAFGALGFGNGVADLPEGLGLRFAGGDHRVADDALLERGAKQLLELRGDVRVARPRSSPRPARASGACPTSGARVSGNVLEHEVEQILRHELEALDAAGARFEEAQQVERAHRALDARPGDGARGDRRAPGAARRR